MRGHLIMSQKERMRKGILSKLRGGYISLQEAAQQMRVSYRQAKRIWKRYREQGDKGLLHRNRDNKAVGHGFSDEFKSTIIARYQERYPGFGPTLASEKLAKEGFELNRETLRRWLLAEGLWKKHRKRSPYRSQRSRRECFGALLQIDGSIHPWFGEELGDYCLVNIVDDATTTTLSVMDDGETTKAVMTALKLWIEKYGIPQEIYVDRKTVYIAPTKLSIFEQACERLGIHVIPAYSPQAKGRVERNHAVYQDRFAKELWLEDIKDVVGANRMLQDYFIDELNTKFAKDPLSSQDAHAPLLGIDLDQVLRWSYKRQLRNDWTISFQADTYQITQLVEGLHPKSKIEVQRYLDGNVNLFYNNKPLPFKCLGKVIKKPKEQRKELSEEFKHARRLKGKSNSPWHHFNPNWIKSSRSVAHA